MHPSDSRGRNWLCRLAAARERLVAPLERLLKDETAAGRARRRARWHVFGCAALASVLLASALLVMAMSFAVTPAAASAPVEEKTVRVGIYENAPKIFTSEPGVPSGIFVDIIQEHRRDQPVDT